MTSVRSIYAQTGLRRRGYEEWRISADGLVAESLGHFDNAEYQRQIEYRVDA